MTDKLIMENYLLVLKSTVEVFVHGTLESSNKKVRDVLKLGLDTIMDSQANTFDLLKSNGIYSVSNVSSDVISKTLNKVMSK